MSDLKICRICVRTEAKMYHINQYQLHLYYEEVMNIKREELDGLPLHLCYECATILYKFHKFKQKCFMGLKVLNNILRDGPITYESVNKIDRKDTLLNSTLAMIPVNGNFKTYIITEKTKQIQENIENIDLDCKSESSFSDRDEIQEIVENIKTNSEDEKMGIDEENKANTASIVSPTVVYIEDENGATKTDSNKDVIGNSKKGKGKIYETLHALDDISKWKKSILSEEDAMKEFRAKADDKKYLAAAFKCKDCFKGFSKKNMLDRHIQLRHVEELGSIVCHFCRHRFKLECYLTKHIKQHYTRYECLRCNVIYSLENSAVLHEEYHSGATRKCNYCGEEFRHASTYYSHLRSHRSEHVCALCGASFVSALGLRQHKTIKHVIMDIESPDDDEEVNTYCEKCSIRFDTRKAYEEHLFHSALHGDDDLFKNNDSKPDSCDEKTNEESSDAHEKVSKSKKVLAKKEQAKITKIIKKRSVEHPIDVIAAAEGRKRFKKKTPRRRRRKPTTCHQCGKHFDTQAACMKHHINAHPRTSFHSPYERYICEICGASLAPGSIAVHQNIHTREKLHTCDTCGRQFHASVGLKRHMLTHTGEKPFGCPLCEKKFTQNNSMKLHYRTFHLKQPYPKRNRRPKKDEPKETVEARKSSSEESSSSFDSLPDVQSRDQSGIDPVTGAVTSKPDDTINYLIN